MLCDALQDIADALADDSVDIFIDNYGARPPAFTAQPAHARRMDASRPLPTDARRIAQQQPCRGAARAGAKGTADKAMHAIRAGGVYLVLPGGNGGTVSKHPKAAVTQINYGLTDASKHEQLDLLKAQHSIQL